MQILKLSNSIDTKKYLSELGVDSGGISILSSKISQHVIYIKDLHVGGANILKQDALSIGADLAVPRGTVIAKTPLVDCMLIATTKQLQKLSRKELAQPFGLKDLAKKLQDILKVEKPLHVDIMGVINANDDSFFSGSRFKGDDALHVIEKMIEDGANIIDIGYEPEVISYALESGFKMVNDITGLANDEVCRLCASYDATAVIMHMQGRPQTMQDNPQYENILSDVYLFLTDRIRKAESFGINDIIIDIGIGFGKSLEDNLMLIKHLEHFLTLQKPILVGASRKSMIDKISSSSPSDRLAGSLALHLEAVKNGASTLRVHDVKEHIQAIKVQEAIDNI